MEIKQLKGGFDVTAQEMLKQLFFFFFQIIVLIGGPICYTDHFNWMFTIFGKNSLEIADKFSFELRRLKKKKFFFKV